MRVLRGRPAGPEADRERTAAMVEETAATGEPAVRAWTPHRQLAFGRRDVRADAYERAAETAREHGFPPHERSVGGRAVAYTGSTVAFARVEPVADFRTGLDRRYDAMTKTIQRALWKLGVPARRGEPEGAFCPGQHSLQHGGKLVGVAQRVTADVALVSGVLVVDDREEIAAVLDPVYDALGVPFDPESVGSLARADGRADPEAVCETVESALVGDDDVEVVRVDEAG